MERDRAERPPAELAADPDWEGPGRERGRGGGGIDELELPGLSVSETLRLPVEAAREARGADLSHTPIEVLLERTTADFPTARGGRRGEPPGAEPARRRGP